MLSNELKNELNKLDSNILESDWLKHYSEDEIKTALEVVKQNAYVKNPVGLFRKALQSGWKPSKSINFKKSEIEEKVKSILGFEKGVDEFIASNLKTLEQILTNNHFSEAKILIQRKYDYYKIDKII